MPFAARVVSRHGRDHVACLSRAGYALTRTAILTSSIETNKDLADFSDRCRLPDVVDYCILGEHAGSARFASIEHDLNELELLRLRVG
jgi:hypothetical protein